MHLRTTAQVQSVDQPEFRAEETLGILRADIVSVDVHRTTRATNENLLGGSIRDGNIQGPTG